MQHAVQRFLELGCDEKFYNHVNRIKKDYIFKNDLLSGCGWDFSFLVRCFFSRIDLELPLSFNRSLPI